MTTDLEGELRAALSELADEARLADLARPALRMGRQLRARRNAFTAAAAVIAAAAVVLPFAVLRNQPANQSLSPPPSEAPSEAPSSPAATATPAPPTSHAPRPVPVLGAGPVTLPGGWLVASSPGRSGTWVYDRSRSQYRQISYGRAVPAPTGDLVAVQRSSDSHMGLLNMRTGKVQWISGPANVVGTVGWNPDGSRLVYPGAGTVSSALRLVVVDAATGHATTLPTNIECYENCAPYWLPGETDIAMPLLDKPMEGLRVYSSVDGSARPPIAVAGAVGNDHAWSPDGRHVVALAPDGVASGTYVVEVATGRRVGQLAGVHPNAAYWAGPEELIAVTARGVSVFTLDGTEVDRYPLPVEFVPAEAPQTVLAHLS
jgi:hypothetical protein